MDAGPPTVTDDRAAPDSAPDTTPAGPGAPTRARPQPVNPRGGPVRGVWQNGWLYSTAAQDPSLLRLTRPSGTTTAQPHAEIRRAPPRQFQENPLPWQSRSS
ncbi:hypothetical protein GCM10018787_41740 [Streptomyces thermodiastaticus]|nr:hypothetical protein GCM10018787_41740 [Streptomyces thermodiastaticus]